MMIRKFLISIFFFASLVSARAVEETFADDGFFRTIKGKYDDLSDNGKFIAAAVAGFIGTRIAVGSAMGAIKVGAAAFIAAEVLHYTGVTDDIKLSQEQSDVFLKFKAKALNTAESFRSQIRRRLTPSNIQSFVDKQRPAALGLASGAFVGVLL